MKRYDYMKTSIAVLAAAAVLLLLSACSGVIGGDTVVRISVPGLTDSSSARHISSNATNGYVVVLKKDKVYSLNNFDGKAFNYLVNGQVYITNLPTGDYIFGVALMSADDDNYGLAIKEVKIGTGFNDVVIEVGPGISSFNIGGIGDIDNPFVPDGFTAEFATDTMILDYNRSGTTNIDFNITFGPSETVPIISDANQIGGDGDGLDLGASPFTLPADASGVEFVINSGAFSYTLLLK